MKKLSLLLVAIVSFIGVSTVKADTYSATAYYNYFTTNYAAYNTYAENIQYMVDYWQEHYSQDYPYYAVLYYDTYATGREHLIVLYYSTSNLITVGSSDLLYSASFVNEGDDFGYRNIRYDTQTTSYYYDIYNLPVPYVYATRLTGSVNYGNRLLRSNGLQIQLNNNFNVLNIPSYENQELGLSFPAYELEDGDLYPSFVDLVGGSYQPNPMSSYVEINLNNYPYVALSLKDYDRDEAFTTNIYTKGQLCLTPVYNYGMEEKDFVTDRCSVVYDNFEIVRTFILQKDIENHAIYYVKAYDTTIENKIKVDTNIFDITYITSENASNPSVLIGGRSYPTIAYGDLTTTTTSNEANNYIPGQSENFADYVDKSFGDLFTNPLKTLKTVYQTIVSIMFIITTFIGLLPPVMQAFLYIAFGVAIALGIVKILL